MRSGMRSDRTQKATLTELTFPTACRSRKQNKKHKGQRVDKNSWKCKGKQGRVRNLTRIYKRKYRWMTMARTKYFDVKRKMTRRRLKTSRRSHQRMEAQKWRYKITQSPAICIAYSGRTEAEEPRRGELLKTMSTTRTAKRKKKRITAEKTKSKACGVVLPKKKEEEEEEDAIGYGSAWINEWINWT